MLDFRTLLEAGGLDPQEVLLIRHTAREPRLQAVLPWLAAERHELFLNYQRIQWRAAERFMMKARYVAAFIGIEPHEAVFAGISRVVGREVCDAAAYAAFPGNAELIDFGMASDRPDEPFVAFDLEEQPLHREWLGKLVVSWSAGRSWARWANRNSFPVAQIARDSLFVGAMPDWRDLSLSWNDLRALPRAWMQTLSHWRGIYYIFDTERRAGYVGSASGVDNVLGRWRDYAASGHGGNVGLRASSPDALRFSMLQRTSPDLPSADVVMIESGWKRRLSTLAYGLNAN